MRNVHSILLQILCTVAAFRPHAISASKSTDSQRSDLQVRWETLRNPWPSKLCTYRVEPTVFSPLVISNLMAITGYTANDMTTYGSNGMTFGSPKKAGTLGVSFPLGSIEYWTTAPFGPTNLAENVPEEKELFRLTTNLIAQLGIGLSELVRKPKSAEPDIRYIETQTVFTYKGGFITNITSREAHFSRRLIDRVEFIGFYRGGNGVIEYGDHGKILKISISWRKVICDKALRTVTPKMIMRWMREGKVLPENMPGTDGPPIRSWAGVKRVTITSARAVCLGPGGLDSPASPIELRPFAALEGTVYIGTTNFDVEIDCPLFEDSSNNRGKKGR